jgi:hypothetical protein
MVCRPISLQARMTRTAISPRLAMSTFWKPSVACPLLALACSAVRAREAGAWGAKRSSEAPRNALLAEAALPALPLTALKAAILPAAGH